MGHPGPRSLALLAIGLLLGLLAIEACAPLRTPSPSATGAPSAATATSAIDPNCVVSSVQSLDRGVIFLNPKPVGFDLDRAGAANPTPARGTAPSDVNTVPQLYYHGTCLSCNPPAGSGAPDVGLYKDGANFSVKKDWITFIGEMSSHPPFPASVAGRNYAMRNGWWGDVWAVTPDGAHWYNLTNMVSRPTPTAAGATNPPASAAANLVGSLSAHLSPDETKLIWASIAGRPATDVLGTWKVMVADFVVTNGVPRLENVRDITPAGSKFNEIHDWSKDSTKVVLTSDAGLPYQYGADNWVLDVNTGALTNITNEPLYWEEHTYYSPSGRKLLMSKQYPNPPILPQTAGYNYLQWRPLLKNEAWVMNPDGSQAMQLTGFNTPAPAGTPDPELDTSAPSTTVTAAVWNHDGTQIILPQVYLEGRTATLAKVKRWLVTFAGRCG